MDVDEPASRVKIVCYPDVTTVFPTMKKTSRATLSKMSAKDIGTLRGVQKEENRAIVRDLYKRDQQLYQKGVQTDRQ